MATVKTGKGLVTRRQRGKPLDQATVQGLVQTYAVGPIQERLALAQQWAELVQAGVPACIIEAEYGVSNTTLRTALADPKHWSEAPLRIGRAGSYMTLGVKRRKINRPTNSERRAERSKKLLQRSRMQRGNKYGNIPVGDSRRD